MSKPKAEYRVGVGASSILMILVVLAMTALSLLSFSSAQKAEVMGKRSVTMITAFYEAAANVQYKLAVIDGILMEVERDWTAGESSATDEEAFARDHSQSVTASQTQLLLAAFTIHGLDDVSLVEEEEKVQFSFSMDAGYERVIQVKGIIDLGENPRCQITAHELVSQQAEDNDGGVWEYSLWQASDLNSEPIGDE